MMWIIALRLLQPRLERASPEDVQQRAPGLSSRSVWRASGAIFS